MKTKDVYQFARDNCGFLTAEHVDFLAKDAPRRPLLVRCGAKRFIAAAQDVAPMVKAVEAAGDYVRDVSIPAGDSFWNR